jgi:hypothetical protein
MDASAKDARARAGQESGRLELADRGGRLTPRRDDGTTVSHQGVGSSGDSVGTLLEMESAETEEGGWIWQRRYLFTYRLGC